MTVTEADVVRWLQALPDKRFFEVVYSAAVGRGPDELDRAWLQSHVVLGVASRSQEDDGAWSQWWVELVGLPVADANWEDDAPVCEVGTHCGVHVVSWAKELRCPVCGAATYGT